MNFHNLFRRTLNLKAPAAIELSRIYAYPHHEPVPWKPSSPRPSPPAAGGEGEGIFRVCSQGSSFLATLGWMPQPLWGAEVQGFNARHFISENSHPAYVEESLRRGKPGPPPLRGGEGRNSALITVHGEGETLSGDGPSPPLCFRPEVHGGSKHRRVSAQNFVMHRQPPVNSPVVS
jgi:hypothetical protein